MSKSDQHRKLAEGIAALEKVGFEVEEASVEDMMDPEGNPLIAMMGRPETVEIAVFKARFPDGPEQELPDDDDFEKIDIGEQDQLVESIDGP